MQLSLENNGFNTVQYFLFQLITNTKMCINRPDFHQLFLDENARKFSECALNYFFCFRWLLRWLSTVLTFVGDYSLRLCFSDIFDVVGVFNFILHFYLLNSNLAHSVPEEEFVESCISIGSRVRKPFYEILPFHD